MMEKISTEIIEFLPDNVPAFLHKETIETVRSRCFIIGQIKDNGINLLITEGEQRKHTIYHFNEYMVSSPRCSPTMIASTTSYMVFFGVSLISYGN